VAIFILGHWPNSGVILQLFSISFGTVSVSVFALIWHHSGSSDSSSLCGEYASIRDIRRMLGELIVSDRGIHSLALLRVCLMIHL
jgi:hypothetical protein